MKPTQINSRVAKLRDRGIRVEVDERNEKMQYKIRASNTKNPLSIDCWW